MSKPKKKAPGLCIDCGADELASKIENRRLPLAGGWTVTVEGAQVVRCPNCDYEGVVFPAGEELEHAVARKLVHKATRLAPEEVTFLRTFLGHSGRKLADILGEQPSAISRWENGRKQIPAGPEHFLRTVVAARVGAFDRTFEADVLPNISDKKTPPWRLRLHQMGGRWEAYDPAGRQDDRTLRKAG